MDKPELHLQLLIDKLLHSSYSFAIYRLPWTDEPILVLQQEGDAEQIDSLTGLNGKEGFIFAPFCPNSQNPVLIIRPDIHLRGWNDMMQALSELFSKSILEEDTYQEVQQFGASTPADNPITREEENRKKYDEAFSRFSDALKKHEYEKLVLSRNVSFQLTEDFSPLEAFITACNSYPRMMVSICHTRVGGIWIGSTPEIILKGQQPNWQTVALAGTMAMQGEDMPTEWSPKNKKEQQIVSEYIQDVLKSFKSKAELKGPYTARAGHLVHLKTDIHFTLKNADHLGDLLAALHPTPAVCGIPKESAYQYILNNEGYDRSFYSGIIGWLDPRHITHLYVNLRCMNIKGKVATLYAGGGILASSVADAEWEETQIKMNTMKKCLC